MPLPIPPYRSFLSLPQRIPLYKTRVHALCLPLARTRPSSADAHGCEGVAVQHGGQGRGDNQPPRASIGRDEYLLMHRKMVLALDPATLPAEATQVGLDHRFMGRLILTLSLALALPLIRT